MESDGLPVQCSVQGLQLRLLGPPRLMRGGEAVPLPPSRKVRALLAYLAVSASAVSRERLCDLLWEVPNDPRGELRWSLSRLRALLDDTDRKRVLAAEDRIALDLEDCDVDVVTVRQAVRKGLGKLDLDQLRCIDALSLADFLESAGAELGAAFQHWLAGLRSEFRSHAIAVAAEICRRTPEGSAEALVAARRWLDLAPLDIDANMRFLSELLARRMLEECHRHLDAAARLFAADGLDFARVREAWERLRSEDALPPASAAATVSGPDPQSPAPTAAARRASVAIMPFRELRDGAVGRSTLGNAVTHDVISRLARLRSLFVIARGSVFAVADEDLGPQEAASRLGVDYVASGFLEQHGAGIDVTVEVAEGATARIVWTGQFDVRASERLAMLNEIGDGIVSSIAAEIENAERNRAILKHPDSLDAWEAYHRGLWHMYMFTPEENARAAEFFRLSARLDPTFSRAHAGLSFTHWQNAFQRWGDRADETRSALAAAGQSLLVDDQNPAAHWSMGRALWLTGNHDEAVRELEQSVQLSPNFALGHYALSFVHSQSGDPAAAINASDHSRLLSPCDPLLFGMLGTRAMALVRLGAFEEAAGWACKAAARPNAHVHILAIAAHCLALAGRMDEAVAHAARLRQLSSGYRVDDLLETFCFAADAEARYREAAARIGLRA